MTDEPITAHDCWCGNCTLPTDPCLRTLETIRALEKERDELLAWKKQTSSRAREVLNAHVARQDELRELLADALNQACTGEDGKIDSMALSAYANGLRALARSGHFIIDTQHGRRVVGHWYAEDATVTGDNRIEHKDSKLLRELRSEYDELVARTYEAAGYTGDPKDDRNPHGIARDALEMLRRSHIERDELRAALVEISAATANEDFTSEEYGHQGKAELSNPDFYEYISESMNEGDFEGEACEM